MSKIDRYDGDFPTFGENFQSQERTTFGTEDVGQNDLTENMNQSWQRGWGIISPSEFPPIQYFNAVGFTLSRVLEYLHQMGVAEWDVEQEFYTGSFTQKGGSFWASQSGTDGSPNVGNDPETDDGTNWVKVPNAGEITPTTQTFTADGTWTKPSGVKRIKVIGIGGGGAGGGAPLTGVNETSAGGGGGGGGGFILNLDATSLTSESVTVGSGGAAANGGDGGDGGDTSFGAFATASGGSGGPASSSQSNYSGDRGGAGGGSTGGDFDQSGQGGGSCLRLGDRTASANGNEMVSVSGAGGSPGVYSGSGAAGGINGGSAGTGNSGAPAQGFGGGGGGGANGSDNSALPGGAGAPGILIVTEYYY